MGSFPIPLGKSLESFAHDRNFGSHITFYHRYCQEKHFTVHSKVTKFSWLKLRSYNHLFVVTFEEFHLCKWFISDQNKCNNWITYHALCILILEGKCRLQEMLFYRSSIQFSTLKYFLESLKHASHSLYI